MGISRIYRVDSRTLYILCIASHRKCNVRTGGMWRVWFSCDVLIGGCCGLSLRVAWVSLVCFLLVTFVFSLHNFTEIIITRFCCRYIFTCRWLWSVVTRGWLCCIVGVLTSEGWWEARQPSPSNQELLVVRDKVGRPPGELGVSKSMECDIFPFSA